MDNKEALDQDSPVNRVIKKIYRHFEDGYSLFEFFSIISSDEWEEFKRFIELDKNFYHIAFACWHWSCDKEWLTKDELLDIMNAFNQLISTVELGRTGKIIEKEPCPGWNIEAQYLFS